MDKTKSVIARILSIWTGIGVLLALVASQGIIDLPDWSTSLFSENTALMLQESVDVIFTAIGVVIAAAQQIRAIFINQPSGEVGASSIVNVRKLIFNPLSLG